MVPSMASAKEGRKFLKLASYGWPAIIMHYTYVIESELKPDERYIGHTSDLKQRLFYHNSGKCCSPRFSVGIT